MPVTLRQLEARLRDSPNQWRLHAARVICDVPDGYLCTYGEIAEEANRRIGLSLNARNIGWLRGHLYALTLRDTDIPLHRLAKSGDARCLADSSRTRRDAMRLRQAEGSWQAPRWWRF